MTKAKELLKNLTFDYSWMPIHSVEDGIRELRGKQKDLEAVHIYLENLSPKTYPPKKKYFNISRVDAPTKLDEWIFENLVDQREYGEYLEKYLSNKNKFKYDDVDKYILDKHYRPEAIKILSKTKRLFNLRSWTKKRYRYVYKRKTNLCLKDGSSLCFDFRNLLVSFFILKDDKDKQILALGGSGSSGQREKYTIFTAVFYLLGKKKKIKHHFLRYDSFNRYQYIGFYNKPIITWDLGSNYSLDQRLKSAIKRSGLELNKILKLK